LQRANLGVFGAVNDVTTSNAVVPALHQLHLNQVLNLLDSYARSVAASDAASETT
jgi:maleate cis-trans isomerase